MLQDTRNDIREKKWAQPLVRETMRAARRITRAHEEVSAVNREARRIHTSIRDEDELFSRVVSDLAARDDILLGAVKDYVRRRRGVNAHLLAHLLRLYALDGFTGVALPGVHAGPPREHPPMSSSMQEGERGSATPEASTPASPSIVPEGEPMQSSWDVTLTSAEMTAVVQDDAEDDLIADEDEEGAVSELVEHMSNIAVLI